MAPVIWGLNLGEIQWSKFKSSYMWNTDYHLRRTKFIVYQLAMILCVVSESLGTAALTNYIDQEEFINGKTHGQGLEYNDDYVGIGSYNIFTGVFIATIFGAAFFFDLFWPERHESVSVRWAWKICAVLSTVFVVGDLIALTIITASKRAYVTGIDPGLATLILSQRVSYNLVYRKNGRALAALVFLWLGFPFVVASTIILWVAKVHDERVGPLSSHERARRAQVLANTNGINASSDSAIPAAKFIPGENQVNPGFVNGSEREKQMYKTAIPQENGYNSSASSNLPLAHTTNYSPVDGVQQQRAAEPYV